MNLHLAGIINARVMNIVCFGLQIEEALSVIENRLFHRGIQLRIEIEVFRQRHPDGKHGPAPFPKAAPEQLVGNVAKETVLVLMADEAPAKLLLIHDAYLRQKHLFNRLHPLVDHGKPGKQDIRRVLRKQLHRLLQVGLFQPIVGVQELNPFSPRMGKADISRVGDAAIGDIDHPNAIVLSSQPHDQAQARIR